MTVDFFAVEAGDVLPDFAVRADADAVRAYLDATGEAASVSDGLWEEIVPPLALGAFVFSGLLETMPLARGTLHTGQEFDFRRPVLIGEELTARITVARRSERRELMMTVLMLELRDGDDIVVTGRTTLVNPVSDRADGVAT